MSHKVKINFLRTVNTLKTETKKEIGIRLDGLSQQLLANPKASYAFSDIGGIIHDAKNEMVTLNDRTFDSFSKSFLGLLGVSGGGDDAGSGSGDFDPGMSQELDNLRLENQQLQSEMSRLRSSRSSSGSSNEQVVDLQKRLGNTEIDLERKQVEIQKLQIQLNAARETSAGADTAQTYIKQVNKIKNELDLIIQERDALQGSVRRLEATLKNNENDLRASKEEIMKKNAEIDSLASKMTEISELQAQNDQLKEAVIKAGDKIKQLTREMDNLKEQAEQEILKAHDYSKQEILSIKAEMDTLNRTLEETQDEKEILLIDSQETTEAVQYYKEIATTSSDQISSMKSEIEGLEQQLQMIMAGQSMTQSPTTSVTSMLDSLDSMPESVEAEDTKQLKESLAQYRAKETTLNDKVLDLENKLSDATSEIDLKDKQIEVHVNRVKELQKNLNSMKVELEDIRKERDEMENSLNSRELELERERRALANSQKEKERIERDTMKIREELEDTLSQQLDITERAERTEKELNVSLDRCKSDNNREKKTSDFFRRELERLPKYVILFVLQEVRKAKLIELQKTIHRPALWVKREVQSLVQEGWVNEIEGGEAVELIKDFPPVT